VANRKHTKTELVALRAKREANRERYTDYDNPNQVLAFKQWCRVNKFSDSTGKRVLASGACKYVMLSERRIGITVGANREYQQNRTKKAG
jgi:hypothetical protein